MQLNEVPERVLWNLIQLADLACENLKFVTDLLISQSVCPRDSLHSDMVHATVRDGLDDSLNLTADTVATDGKLRDGLRNDDTVTVEVLTRNRKDGNSEMGSVDPSSLAHACADSCGVKAAVALGNHFFHLSFCNG